MADFTKESSPPQKNPVLLSLLCDLHLGLEKFRHLTSHTFDFEHAQKEIYMWAESEGDNEGVFQAIVVAVDFCAGLKFPPGNCASPMELEVFLLCR